MLEIIYAQNVGIGEWLAKNMNTYFDSRTATTLGVKHNNKIIAAVSYENYQDKSIEMHIYTEGIQWAQKSYIKQAFFYPFKQLGVEKCIFKINENNKKCIDFVKKMGAIEEARIKRKNNDLIFYTLTLEQFKYKD